MRTPIRKRGRPAQSRPMNDTGTPELVMKRLHGETAEMLDMYLERAVITQEQHWCGIHLRWLYTLRFGAPGVRATDPTNLGGLETAADDPEWRASREAEYNDALTLLGHRAANLLLSVAIHNERPTTHNMQNFRDALELLVKHWCRRRQAS